MENVKQVEAWDVMINWGGSHKSPPRYLPPTRRGQRPTLPYLTLVLSNQPFSDASNSNSLIRCGFDQTASACSSVMGNRGPRGRGPYPKRRLRSFFIPET